MRKNWQKGAQRVKSKTKNLLCADQIRSLVKIHFGESCEVDNITELKGGMFNAIYRMDRIYEGDRIVLKVGVIPGTPLLTYERDVMPTEVECFRLVAEQTTVPVPKILAFDFSKQHIPSNYFFMTALEGVPLSRVSGKMPSEQLNRIKAELADYLAQMHQIEGPYYGYFTNDPKQQYPTWREGFTHMFDQILRDCQTHQVRLPYERIRRAFERTAGYLEEVSAPALVEYDCHEGNIFVKRTDATYHIEGILDLERAFWGDPLADFPAAFVFTDDIRKESAFLDAYLKASDRIRDYEKSQIKRYQLYRLYLMLIMTAEIFRYGFFYGQLQALWAKHQLQKCLRELEK